VTSFKIKHAYKLLVYDIYIHRLNGYTQVWRVTLDKPFDGEEQLTCVTLPNTELETGDFIVLERIKYVCIEGKAQMKEHIKCDLYNGLYVFHKRRELDEH